jgi:hypothetical protein
LQHPSDRYDLALSALEGDGAASYVLADLLETQGEAELADLVRHVGEGAACGVAVSLCTLPPPVAIRLACNLIDEHVRRRHSAWGEHRNLHHLLEEIRRWAISTERAQPVAGALLDLEDFATKASFFHRRGSLPWNYECVHLPQALRDALLSLAGAVRLIRRMDAARLSERDIGGEVQCRKAVAIVAQHLAGAVEGESESSPDPSGQKGASNDSVWQVNRVRRELLKLAGEVCIQ